MREIDVETRVHQADEGQVVEIQGRHRILARRIGLADSEDPA